ncbi:MAG: pyruvate/2-oxoglutarate dehydrogenase complex dihydrolipoamide dehydrogenase (E3) component [Paracoccaceae bacterium]
MGVRVSLIDADPLLSRDDPELSAYVKNALLSEGVELYTEQKIQSIEQAHGEIRLDIAGGVSIKGSHVLIAAGRVAQVDGLNLHLADVKIGKNGIIAGPDLRTTNKRIYAMGDALQDGLRFTHVAGYHAGVLVRSLLFGLRAGQKTQHIPRVTYSDPELAQVGLTEAQARLLYHDKITVISQSLALSDRAQTQGKQDQGLIKLIVHKGRAIGVGITGPNAGELISIWALVLAEGVKLSALARAVFPYPTLSEISKRAVGTYFSPKLFGNAWIRYWVLFVQRYL